MKVNNKTEQIVSFIIFLVSLIFSYIFGELYYNSIDGTDFYRYFQYIEYFEGSSEETGLEQGLFYFMIVSNFIEFSQNYYLPDKWEFIYSTAIQFCNFILYLVGLLGLYLYLVSKKINKSLIFLSFSALNFFPPLFGGRIIMKPEILAFCFLPWILLSIDSFLKNNDTKFLVFASPLLAILATSKATMAFLILSTLVYLYYDHFSIIWKKELILPFLIFATLFSSLYFENLNINKISMLFHPELEQYLFKAPLSFIYNINFNELFFNPYRNTHSNSLIGITLIDLFGDYFNRYWDHPRSIFSLNRVDTNFLPHPRRNLSLIMSIIFVILTLFYKRDKFNKYTKVYLIGIFVLALTSLGTFGLHFNPEKGDTVKTHYYFYLLSVSFVFLIIKLLSKKKFILQVVLISLLIVASLFIFGFPKNFDSDINKKIEAKVPTTVTCLITSNYFENSIGVKINCLNKFTATCGDYESYAMPETHPDGYLIFQNDDFFQPLNLRDSAGYTITVNGYAECLNYVEGGYYRNTFKYNEDRSSLINIICLYLSLTSLFLILIMSTKTRQY